MVEENTDTELNVDDINLENIQKLVLKSIEEENEILESLNKTIDYKEYNESFHKKEFYEILRDKFFDRDYVMTSNDRLTKIKNYLEEQQSKYVFALEAVNYQIKTDDDVEAYEKEFICSEILEDFFTVKEVIKEEKPTLSKEESKKKMMSLLGEIEDEDKKIEDDAKAQKKSEESIKLAPLTDRIQLLYDKCIDIAKVKDGEEDGVVFTYLDDLFNPTTTKLDENNLYINLRVVEIMQEFDIIDWDFDTNVDNLNSIEYDLSDKHWDETMNEDLEDMEKYFKVLEKNFRYRFYSAIFEEIAKEGNADRDEFSERDLKYKNVLSDDDTNSTMEEYLIECVEKKSEENNIIIVTPEMENYIDIDQPNTEEIMSNSHIKYLGRWKTRWIFSVTTKNFTTLKKLNNGIFFIKKGNRYTINPNKPLAYFHSFENPFLDKPILKLYINLALKFFMANTTVMFVRDMD